MAPGWSSAVEAQRAIREAGVARARPSSSSSRAVVGSAAAVGRPAAVEAPSVRNGASARPNRSAQCADTASTAATVPRPAARPSAVRSSRRAVATSPLSIATAPHSRNAIEAWQAASYVAATGEVGVAAGVSARQIRWMPAAAPAAASRAVSSRSAAEPGSPSTTTTVYGPVYRCAASAIVARSWLAQPGPSGPSSSRRTSSVVRAVACSRSYARSSRHSWPCIGRRWGSQPSQAHSRLRSSAPRARSVLISTISRSAGECSAASWATVERASPASLVRGPASPSEPASRSPTVTGTAGSSARSVVPSRTTRASGWEVPRSHSRGPGPSAVSSTAAGSGQTLCAAGPDGASWAAGNSGSAAPVPSGVASWTGSPLLPASLRAQAPIPPRRGDSSPGAARPPPVRPSSPSPYA